jgi:hypothetical protein
VSKLQGKVGDHRRQQWNRSCDGETICCEGTYVFITGRRKTELDEAVAVIG